MTTSIELSTEIEQLETRLKDLKAKYNIIDKPKPKKQESKRIERCSECNIEDSITNLVRISNTEYIHSKCVLYVPDMQTPLVKRKVYNVSLSLEDINITDMEIKDTIEVLFSGCTCRILTSRIIET